MIASRAADFEAFSNSQFREDKHSAPAPVHTPASSKASYRSTPPVQHRTPQPANIQIKEEPRPQAVIPPPVRASSAQAAQFPPTAYGTINHALFPHMPHPGSHIPGPHPYSIPPLGGLPADRPGVLMHNRGAPPAGARYNIPQIDGASATPEDDFANMLAGHGGAARRRMLARYPWMREAKFGGSDADAQGEMQIPQVDGPSGGGGSSIPPLSLNLSSIPTLTLPSTNGIKKEDAAEVPTLSTTLKLADIPPLQMPAHAHPSLKSPPPPPSAPLSRSSTIASTSTMKTEDGKGKPTPIANFARNPNLPAQANEDINSDLDDSDEEETEDPNGLPTDPDANVTYCTYDKVRKWLGSAFEWHIGMYTDTLCLSR